MTRGSLASVSTLVCRRPTKKCLEVLKDLNLRLLVYETNPLNLSGKHPSVKCCMSCIEKDREKGDTLNWRHTTG